jgi:hypothetical protein
MLTASPDAHGVAELVQVQLPVLVHQSSTRSAVGRGRPRLEAAHAELEDAGEPRVAAPARAAGLAEPAGRGG